MIATNTLAFVLNARRRPIYHCSGSANLLVHNIILVHSVYSQKLYFGNILQTDDLILRILILFISDLVIKLHKNADLLGHLYQYLFIYSEEIITQINFNYIYFLGN